MRRTMAFIAGMLFGMIFLVATLGVGLYVSASVVKPSDVWSDSEKYLGDLSDMTLTEIIKEFVDIYNTSAMNRDPQTGEYYSVADFEKDYNVDVSALVGVKLNDDIKKLPFLSIFTPDGLKKVMDQTPVNAITGFLDFLGDEAKAELANHSISELFGENPMAVFNNIKLKQLLPELVSSGNQLMVALGESYIGAAFTAVTSGNLLAELLPDGAFVTVGQLELKSLLGDESALVTSILGSHQIMDIISADGSVKPEILLSGLYVGNLVNYTRVDICNGEVCTDDSPDHVHQSHYWLDSNGKQVTGADAVIADISVDQLTEGNISGQLNNVMLGTLMYSYNEISPDGYEDISSDGSIWRKQQGTEQLYAKKINGKYYEAKLICTDTAADHLHTSDCASVLWYDADGNAVDGFTSLIGEITVGQLTGGLDVSGIIGDVKLSEIMNTAGTMFEELGEYTFNQLLQDETFNDIQLGTFMELQTVSVDVTDGWTQQGQDIYTKNIEGKVYTAVLFDDQYYIAYLNCKEQHVHDIYCYVKQRFEVTAEGVFPSGYSEPQGVAAIIARLTLNDIKGNGINDVINDLTLKDVMPDAIAGNAILESIADIPLSQLNTRLDEVINDLTLKDVLGEANCTGILASFADTKIGQLANSVNGAPVGSLMGLYRKEVSDLSQYTTAIVADSVLTNETEDSFVKKDGDKWYEVVLKCTDQSHSDSHTAECYQFVWYEDAECQNVAEGIGASIANLKVSELTAEKLQQSISGLTLKEVLGEENCTGVLKNLKDTKITEIGTTIDNMYIGTIMGYARKPYTNIDGFTDTTAEGVKFSVADGRYIKAEGDKWYAAQLQCDLHTDSEHTASCYEFVWYTDTEYSLTVTGISKAFVNLTVSQLQDTETLTSRVYNLTLSEIGVQSDSPLLKSMSDVKLKDIGTAIDNAYMGTAMGLYRYQVPDISQYTETVVSGEVMGNFAGKYIRRDGDKWYSATLDCKSEESGHAHTADCYGFVWYTDSGCLQEANTMNSLMANNRLSQLDTTAIVSLINSLTMQDLSGVFDFDLQQENTLNSIFGSDSWKQYTLKEFMDELLSKINPFPAMP